MKCRVMEVSLLVVRARLVAEHRARRESAALAWPRCGGGRRWLLLQSLQQQLQQQQLLMMMMMCILLTRWCVRLQHPDSR